MRGRWLAGSLWLILGAAAGPAGAQQSAASGVSSQLSGIASAGQLPELRWPDFSDYRGHVQNFYQPSGWLWCNLGLRDAKSSFASSI